MFLWQQILLREQEGAAGGMCGLEILTVMGKEAQMAGTSRGFPGCLLRGGGKGEGVKSLS